MDRIEATTLLTKAALDNGLIDLDNQFYRSDHEQAETVNAHNSKQIADFFNSIYMTICKTTNTP